jgi:hypothetical protein
MSLQNIRGGRLKLAAHALAAVVMIALAFPAAALAEQAEGKFEKNLTVSGPVDLSVSTNSGGITVRTGTGGSVRISATIKARDGWRSGLSAEEKVRRIESNPPVEQNGNVIVIGRIEDRELRENVSIRYEISTPADTKLRSDTGSGSMTVDGIRGPLEASTGSGGITAGNIGDAVRATTGSGSIHLDNINGTVRANTGSGGIRANAVGGAFTGSTGSGSIAVQLSAAGDVDVHTGSGGIEVTGVQGALRARTGSGSIRAQGRPTGAWRISTSSGGVTVRLPQDVAFELDASSGSGSVYSAHEITLRGSLSRRELRGKVRGGGPLIELSTASGSIRIE